MILAVLLANQIMETNKTPGNFIPELIPVFIPDDQAKQFLIFQQYYEPFVLLIEKKVFEQKNATISLDFDKFGVLRAIRRQDFLYSSRA